jgi:ectoine hydroxylase-related dioxygenase (phytanoyl-CoA dioxygenase family)
MDGAGANPAGSCGAYGVSRRLPQRDALDEAAAELAIDGYTVLDSGLDARELDAIGAAIDRAYARQAQEMGGESVLASIDDADIARCLLACDARFRELATHPALLEMARRVLGPEFVLLMQNGILNRPDRPNTQRKWHRDLNYQHWTSSQPMALNALLCVDAFTTTNGATYVLPATQHVAAFPTERYVQRHERQVTAPAGSFLVLDAMLFHRGGTNMSGRVRRAVNHVIGLPFMAQQVDLPTALARAGQAPPESEPLRRYLGYRWAPAASVLDWRQARLPAAPPVATGPQSAD